MKDFVKMCEECNPGESEFLQAVTEVAESVKPVLDKNPAYIFFPSGDSPISSIFNCGEFSASFRRYWVNCS